MHVALTDILACPRCGPPHGLILLADAVRDRRVLEGVLGCANCRERFPIRRGAADLRWPRPAEEAQERGDEAGVAGVAAVGGAGGRDDVAPETAAERLAAFIGMDASGGRSFALVAGWGARAAPAMAALVEGVEVVAVEGAGGPEGAGVSRITVGGKLPFSDRSLRGVALTAGSDAGLLEEAARVLHPMGRLLVEQPAPDADKRLRSAGLRVVARDEMALVAVVG